MDRVWRMERKQLLMKYNKLVNDNKPPFLMNLEGTSLVIRNLKKLLEMKW